jgi:hypothetical protein
MSVKKRRSKIISVSVAGTSLLAILQLLGSSGWLDLDLLFYKARCVSALIRFAFEASEVIILSSDHVVYGGVSSPDYLLKVII